MAGRVVTQPEPAGSPGQIDGTPRALFAGMRHLLLGVCTAVAAGTMACQDEAAVHPSEAQADLKGAQDCRVLGEKPLIKSFRILYKVRLGELLSRTATLRDVVANDGLSIPTDDSELAVA